jgi:hypothetical protein
VFEGIDVGRRSAPAFADLNGDGLADLLLGGEDGGVDVWWNASSGKETHFVRATGKLIESPPFSSVSAADLDGDGVLEIMVGTQSGGVLWFRKSPDN